jgi:phosphatidylserine/phosphatidylglycerophosphate/cardiolipin synthase-like enzyme
LEQLSRNELEFLRRAIRRRQLPTPITELALQSVGKGKLYKRLGPLAGAEEAQALALIDAALGSALGSALGAAPGTGSPAGSSPSPTPAAPKPQLVWTGPEASFGAARPTTAVLLELLGQAQEQVIIAGYEIDHGAVLFEPLHKAMAERGVRASIFIDIRPAPSPKSNMDAYLAVEAQKFLATNWPFGAPLPELYYFPAGAAYGSRESFHAKCVVVDGRRVLVGSANFTRRGHQRNVEVGVALSDEQLAGALTAQLFELVEQQALLRLPVAALREAPPVALEDPGEPGDEGAAGAAPAAAVPTSEELADELMVADEARPLFLRLLAAGHPRPEVGDDIEGPDGQVLGTAELCWPERRVAVLLPEQEGSRQKLEAAGWACFSPDAGPEAMERLHALLAREG